LAFRYLNRLEIQSLKKANHIVSITDDFSPFLKRWRITPNKVSVIPNWGPIEQIPVLPRNNSFSKRHGLNGKFVLLYAGTLGRKQNVRLIANIAANLSGHNDIRFVVATDHRGHQLLDRALVRALCPNLLQLPLQTSDQYPYLLASSDAALVKREL
jgi:colanic acid biosynthesis glycosyl transferase WcaI